MRVSSLLVSELSLEVESTAVSAVYDNEAELIVFLSQLISLTRLGS